MYRIYAKVVEEYWYKNFHVTPQSNFRALNSSGAQVTRLANAHNYSTKQEAQDKIDRALANHKKHGHPNAVLFEIRKV